jgi:hypothetical protein
MNRESQIAISIPLRSAVWNWIITFPAEFNEAIRIRGRTEGAPERVFDLLYSMNLTSEERIFWPTLAILNCVSSERMSSEFQLSYSGPTKSSRKVNIFCLACKQLRNLFVLPGTEIWRGRS